MNQIDISQCFDNISETTLEKKPFFYNDIQTKELCTKLALAQRYKEDIFFPKYFHKCFPLCNSCLEYSKEKNDMKCNSCLNGFRLNKGNCYINKRYNSTKRINELNTIFNTLNLNPEINSNDIIKKYLNGKVYFFIENKKKKELRRLYVTDDYDDSNNAIFNREDQSLLTDNKSEIAYNFRIELSPYYTLAKICYQKGKFFIENNKCVDECSPSLEASHGYQQIKINISVATNVDITVCDCSFRCCIKRMNYLYKSLDRGFIDGSYPYFRKYNNGRCLAFNQSYTDAFMDNNYLLAQDFVPCFFPIYNDNDEIEFVISGYGKTIIGNDCKHLCPADELDQFYYFNPENYGCYKCPKGCLECDGIPTSENGHCTKCPKNYHGIFNGFCVDVCPLGYGEKGGIPYICQKCDDNEINFDNKCVLQQDPIDYNYGTPENPSYPDPNNPKLYHRCLEYVSYKKYELNNDSNICPEIPCPEGYIKQEGKCSNCPEGCTSCYDDEYDIKCSSCEEKYVLVDGGCLPCFVTLHTGDKNKCGEKCPDGFFINKVDTQIDCFESCFPFYSDPIHNECKEDCGGLSANFVGQDINCFVDCGKDYPEYVDGQCLRCPLVGAYNYNGTCVIPDSNFDEIYFIIPGETDEKFGKIGSCYTIDELGDYHPKNETSELYDPVFCQDKKRCPTNFIEKYDANGELYCTKCYETCESCEHTGEAGNHKCTQCKEGYEPSSRMYGVCDQICKEGEFYYYLDTREKKCSDVCPDIKPYMAEPDIEDPPNIECIGNCTDNNQFLMGNTFSCVKECPKDYYLRHMTCFENCPEGEGPLGPNKECANCTLYSLYYYEGKCYNISEEVPLNKYVDINEETGTINTNKEGTGESIFKDCFESVENGIKTGYYSKYSNCSEICPESYYYDTSLKLCVLCSDDCPYCDPENGCEEIYECPSNYLIAFINEFDMKCIKNCPEEKAIYDENEWKCLDFCPNANEKMVISYNGNNKKVECQVINCKDENKYYYSETNTCYDSYKIPENTYYNPDNQNSDENTLSSCFTKISSIEYTTGFFYVLSNCPQQCPDNFYYAGNNKCRKCHPLCDTCFADGTNQNNNCLSCADTEKRILNPYLFNCEKKCDSSFHYDEDTKIIVCDEKCEKEQYIDENTGKCINTCNKLIDGNYCVNSCPDGKNVFNGYCLKDVTIPVVVKTIINPSNPNNQNENSNNNGNNDIIELIKIIERNFTEYIIKNNNNNSSNDNNYKIIQTNDGNITLSELYLNSTILNLGNSLTILYLTSEFKEKLNELYPSENYFYIMQIDLKENKTINSPTISPPAKYKIFLTNGEEIDVNNLFPEIEIIIEKEIKFEKKLENNTKLAYDLIKKGINIFDINDPFFNDMCYSYQDENGNDVTLKSRKEDYFQNILVCINGCQYMGLNTADNENYKIICKCKISSLIINNSSNIYDGSINNLTAITKYDNNDKNIILDLVKCTKDISKKDEIKKNVGLWTYLGFLSLLAGLYLCYCCYDFDSFYSFLYPFSKNEKEDKKEEEEEVVEEEIITKKEYINEVNSKNAKEEIQSEISVSSSNKENPPKKFRISFEESKKDYPKTKITHFGKEGYKLSNKFDKSNLETLGDIDSENYQDYHQNNNYDYSSPRKNTSSYLNNGSNSPSSEGSFNFSQKFSPRQVDLEPEGALLDKNNFFDTCKIVKIPSNISNQEIEKMQLNLNNSISNNNRRNSGFYKQKGRKVNLPGFPSPQINYEDGNDNPINRKNTNLDDMDDSFTNNKKLRNKILQKELENIDNLSDIDIEYNKEKDIYHNYKKNSSRYPHRKGSLINSYTTETFSRHPITINKYYITNNSPDDFYDPLDKNKLKLRNNNYNKNKNGERTVTIRRKKIKTSKNYFSEYFSKYDLDFADYEYAILYDQRPFCQIYYSLLSNFHIFLSIILRGSGKIFIPWNVRGGIAIFTMEIYFTGIALFIDFSTLEKRYKFNDTIDILYLIKNEYSSIIYTSLISKIMNIVTMYFLAHYSINKIIKEYAYKEDLFLEKIKNEINCLKCKYHIFFIICIILTILQGYYIYCFCGVFKGAIKPWIYSSLITFGLNFILSFFIILISTGIRKAGLLFQSWIIYLFSKLVLLLS